MQLEEGWKVGGRLANESVCGDVQEGAVYKVKVVRLMDYGAFVELPNGFQALLHISELANERVNFSDCISLATLAISNLTACGLSELQTCSRRAPSKNPSLLPEHKRSIVSSRYCSSAALCCR